MPNTVGDKSPYGNTDRDCRQPWFDVFSKSSPLNLGGL